MKTKIIILLTSLSSHFLFGQVSINPSSVGIGQNTLSSIPLHIHDDFGSYQLVNLKSSKSYFKISQYSNPAGTAATIYHDEVNFDNFLKFKSANNVFTFYTLDQEQGRIDINANRMTLQKMPLFNGILTIGGPVRFFNYAGLNGDLMASLGNGTPAWSASTAKQPVGFGASKGGTIIVAPATEVDFTNLIEEYDHEAGLNFFPVSGAFIAPSNGLYHFDLSVPYLEYPNTITNGKATLYIKKNNVIVDTMLKSFSGYGANLQYSIGLQLSVTLKLVAGDSVKSGIIQTNNLGNNITVGSISNYQFISFNGFKVY